MWTLIFVDDTKASAAVSNNQEMNKLQLVLNKIHQWVSTNDMLVNETNNEALELGKLKKRTSFIRPQKGRR